MSKSYNADNIKSLTPFEHFRLRTEMFLGDTFDNGLMHALKEVITNSTDELGVGYGDYVLVTLLADNRVSVRDNGRGIPTNVNKLNGLTGVELCIGTANSGGKYDKENYATSAGTFGVGASCVNAISNSFEVVVRQNGLIHYCKYEKGVKKVPKKAGTLKVIGECDKNDTGTEITFEADPTVMDVVNFNPDTIKTYMKQLSFVCINNRFIYRDKRDPTKEIEEVYISENGMKDYVEEIIEGKKPVLNEPISLTGTLPNGDKYDVAFIYTQDYKTDISLFVNRNNIPNGGTAVTGFKMGVTKAVNDISKVLGIMKPKEKPLRSNDIEEGMTAVISVTMKNPQLEGQTKNKLNSPEILSALSNATSEYLKDFFENNPKILGAIAMKTLTGRRARERSMQVRNSIAQATQGAKIIAGPSKLKGCAGRKPELNEIMIVEGDSAGGHMVNCRNPETQAFLTLRGKITNIEKLSSIEEAMKSDTIKDIVLSLGCGFGEDFNINKLKYHKIIIMTDADPRP